MSNIIDSLKRLERIGDETSKTNQKLIQAATDLADGIVKQFAAGPDEMIDLDIGGRFLDYQIMHGRLVFFNNSTWKGFVARDRDNALRFSKDVANGLLDGLAEILAKRLEAAQGGLAGLQKARTKNPQ
jgi:hypothetical protein